VKEVRVREREREERERNGSGLGGRETGKTENGKRGNYS
jgi:hypothetical protein